jgi:hypothetical protein
MNEKVEFKRDWLEWLTEHQQLLVGIVLTAAILVGGVFYYIQQGKHKTFSDCTEGAALYTAWEESHFKDQALFDQLSALIERRPQLRAKYAGKMAQVIGGEKGVHFQKEVLGRLGDLRDRFPYHQEYGEVSQLIESGEELQALQRAKELKVKLEETEGSSGKILNAFNLLRIAMLEKKIGTKEGEVAAWEELKGGSAYQLLLEHFSEQGLSLNEYIASRE